MSHIHLSSTIYHHAYPVRVLLVLGSESGLGWEERVEPLRFRSYPLTTTPPFGCKLWPEMKLLSWLARKTKHVATSLGCPGRPIGVPLNCSLAEVVMVAGIRGVQTRYMRISFYIFGFNSSLLNLLGPGHTQFTRIPFLTCWLDNPLVKATIAPFVDV